MRNFSRSLRKAFAVIGVICAVCVVLYIHKRPVENVKTSEAAPLVQRTDSLRAEAHHMPDTTDSRTFVF